MEKRIKISIWFAVSISLIVLAFLLDNLLLQAIPHLRISFLNPAFVFLGGTTGLTAFLIFLSLLFLYEKKIKLIPCLITAALLAGIVSYLLKIAIMRPRPDILPLLIKTTSSFPSAHALIAASTFSFLRKLKPTKVIAFIPAILITFTGYYNGVHYLSDILAGILIGIITSYLTFKKAPPKLKKIKQKLKSLITKSQR